jgi:hypothetical protein
MGINTELKQAIREVIETDRLTEQKLKDILLNGPCDVAKGLESSEKPPSSQRVR